MYIVITMLHLMYMRVKSLFNNLMLDASHTVGKVVATSSTVESNQTLLKFGANLRFDIGFNVRGPAVKVI